MRSLARLLSGPGLAGLLLFCATCGKGSGDGLLSLSLSADAVNPPPAANKLLLTGEPGGISRTHLGLVQLVPGTPVLFQFPALPASDSLITFSVGAFSEDGCQVGRNAQAITATIKAGVETGPIAVTMVSAGPCLDAGAPDAPPGPPDVATSDSSGTGGFAGIGGNTGGGGGGVTVPNGGTGGSASGGLTTTGGSGGNRTGGATSSGLGGNGGGASGGMTVTAGASGGTRTGSGGIVTTGGTSTASGGIVTTGGASTASGGIVATGGSGTGGSNPTCPTTMPSGGTDHCGKNTQGTAAGLTWSLYAATPSANGCLTTFSTPAFAARWDAHEDFLARYGLDFGNSGKPYDQLGTIKADFSDIKDGTVGTGDAYVGAYGWSTNPCVEWYIVDDSWSPMPIIPFGFTSMKGSATIDGETYNLYQHVVNGTGGSKCGVSQWDQIWSVRQKARSCGTISISEHFKAWKDKGWNLGSLLEAKIFVEVYGGKGRIDFPVANVTNSP